MQLNQVGLDRSIKIFMLKNNTIKFFTIVFLTVGLLACGGGSDSSSSTPKTPAATYNIKSAFQAEIESAASTKNYSVSGIFADNQIIGTATLASGNYIPGTFTGTTPKLGYNRTGAINIQFSTLGNPSSIYTISSCFGNWYSTAYLPMGQDIYPCPQGGDSVLSPSTEFVVYNTALALPTAAITNVTGTFYTGDRYSSNQQTLPKLGAVRADYQFIAPSGSTEAQLILTIKKTDAANNLKSEETSTFDLNRDNRLDLTKWQYVVDGSRFTLTKK